MAVGARGAMLRNVTDEGRIAIPNDESTGAQPVSPARDNACAGAKTGRR